MKTTKKIRALFFDIDGTLVSFKTHRIPQSTVDALTEAKRRGVKVFISTGRPIPFIVNLGQIASLIDGYITTNGALVQMGGETLACHPIAPDDVKRLLAYSHHVGCPAIVIGQTHIGVQDRQPVVDEVFGKGLGLTDFEFTPLEAVLREPILQVTPFITPEEEAALLPTLNGCNSGRWTTAFTDITAAAADKGQGLDAMATHVGLRLDETMAFGDGGNDVPIIRRAGLGVAMGNGGESVKQAADYVTTSVDDDGVARALREYGVI